MLGFSWNGNDNNASLQAENYAIFLENTSNHWDTFTFFNGVCSRKAMAITGTLALIYLVLIQKDIVGLTCLPTAPHQYFHECFNKD